MAEVRNNDFESGDRMISATGCFWIGVIVVCWIALIIFARSREAMDWNGGYCTCGKPWRYFDTDSQGGRGYKCDDCHQTIWISYNVDGKGALWL